MKLKKHNDTHVKGALCRFGEDILIRRQRSSSNKQPELKGQHNIIQISYLCLYVADPATFLKQCSGILSFL